MNQTAMPDLQELLAERLDGSPRGRLMAEMLKRTTSEQTQNHQRAKRRRRQVSQLVRALQERNRTFARACGACACWGDRRCPVCEGAGRPGWRNPDPEAFTAYIEPALRRDFAARTKGLDLQDLSAVQSGGGHVVGGQVPVVGLVRTVLEHRLVLKLGHGPLLLA